MGWKPIVAGVDASAEGARAAKFAAKLAQAAGTTCHLVHAVRDPWADASLAQVPIDTETVTRLVLDTAESLVRAELAGEVPERVLASLEVRVGPAPLILDEALDEHDAELLVLGGKHHSAIGRWLGGSTVHHMVRRIDVPLLVTGVTTGKVRRVMAAVDLSSAARPTVLAAERFADLFGARLRMVHVVEPLPIVEGLPVGLDDDEVLRRSEQDLERSVWPLVDRAEAEHLIRRGHSAETIANAAAEWDADLLVAGSHGRGWVDRVLIGSVTEKLLNRLPCAVLVVPVSAPARRTSAAGISGRKTQARAVAGRH